MIGTIGSLVQEASNRRRWAVSVSLYIFSSVVTAVLTGAILGAAGHAFESWLGSGQFRSIDLHGGAWFIGPLALAYGLADAGLLRLPRPTLRQAVPITWWRQWRPYGAAAAYGAALGTGVMTRIPFGSFYVICAVSFSRGSVLYGAALVGIYGAARALTLLPASWGAYRHRGAIAAWLKSPMFDLFRAQRLLIFAVATFGTLMLAA